ncbi:MAG: outer membrane protein assembly factor [Gemmatimonadota bacterium]
MRLPRLAPRSVAACVLLGLAAVRPGRAQIAPDLEVVGLRFEGNRTFGNGQLEAAILTERTRCRSFLFRFPFPFCELTDWGFAHDRAYLDGGELPLDVLRLRLFYRQRGFRQADVDTVVTRHGGKARIVFRVAEREPTRVRELAVRGVEGILDSAWVRRNVGLREGAPLDLVALSAGERRITDELRRRGYIDATVLREYFIPRDSLVATVGLDVAPGARVRVGAVQVEGSGGVGDDVIRQQLLFGPGDHFNQDRVLESQRALYGLEALQYANITTLPRDPADTLVDLLVQVAPAPTRTLRSGVGMTTTECAQVELGFTHRNFLGGGRRLGLSGRLSNIFAKDLEGRFPCTAVGGDPVFQELNYRLRADFEQPLFALGRNTLRAGLFLERETVPDLFVRDSRGGEVSLRRRLRPRMELGLSYRPELTSFGKQSADIFFCVNFGFCQPADIGLLSESRWLSPLLLSWSYDRTNRPFSPTDGYYARAEIERASLVTGSDYRYVRGTLEIAGFQEIGPGVVLAGHLRAGAVTSTGGTVFGGGSAVSGDVIHPRKRFFGGGPQSVRGFGLNLLGPTVLVLTASRDCPGQDLEACAAALAPGDFDERPEGGDAAAEGSVELRFRLGRRWSAVGFVDVGQVWKDITKLSAPVATPGFGIRYQSPVGPLRLDVGYNPTRPSRLPVVAVQPDGRIEELATRVRFDPFTFDRPNPLQEFFRRLQLQLSIGEAF